MIQLVLGLALLGFLLYVITTLIPMAPIIKTLIYVVVAVCVVWYVVGLLGFTDIPLPRRH